MTAWGNKASQEQTKELGRTWWGAGPERGEAKREWREGASIRNVHPCAQTMAIMAVTDCDSEPQNRTLNPALVTRPSHHLTLEDETCREVLSALLPSPPRLSCKPGALLLCSSFARPARPRLQTSPPTSCKVRLSFLLPKLGSGTLPTSIPVPSPVSLRGGQRRHI